MKFNALRNLMLSLVVLGLAGSVVTAGTFAQFNAVITSSGNTFTTASITFSDTVAGNTCTSVAGATATGTGCTTAVSTLANIVPGNNKFGTVVLANGGTIPVSVAMSVSDSAPNNLTNTSIGTANTSPSSAGLGLIVLECTTTAGVDEACTTTDASGKVKVLYGSCTGAVTTISTALPVATGTFSTSGVTDNGINVGGTKCWGGNTAAGINGLSGISLSSSLATSTNVSLAVLVYLPPSVSSASLQAQTGNSLTYTWTATQL